MVFLLCALKKKFSYVFFTENITENNYVIDNKIFL